MEISINKDLFECRSTEDFASVLNKINALNNAEVWLNVPEGAVIGLLKSGENAILIYLRKAGDSGFHSVGTHERRGNFQVKLSNGQLDEYPLAWSVQFDVAGQALREFFKNDGAKSSLIDWQEA